MSEASVQKTILGHPPGLFVLFFTEMWERMSYYGMRSLLVLYMANYLFVAQRKTYSGGEEISVTGDPSIVVGLHGIEGALESVFGEMTTQQLASQVYGLYTGFVYFTPFFGGLLADRILGQRKTVVIGAILMAIGHFLMASEAMFFLALLFLIVGNGCFKPNISTQVGGLYPEGDHRRDGAFTIFYMGINLGAFFSPLVCGTLGQTMGWHWGFGAAGVGMLIGMFVYLWGQKYLAPDNRMNDAAAGTTQHPPLTPREKAAIVGLIVLCALNVVFWAVYEQQGNTMQLWADEKTDWHLIPGVDWEVPSTWFQSFNPAMIFIFAPLLARFWAWQDTRGGQPSSVAKMAIGCMLLGAAFIIMIVGAQAIGGGLGSVWWLVGTVFVLTIGELYLSPIGLSLVTKVAPARMVSMLMGMWFLSSFFGNYLSGFIGTFYEAMSKEAFFFMLFVLASTAGVAMFLILRPLKRALGGHEV